MEIYSAAIAQTQTLGSLEDLIFRHYLECENVPCADSACPYCPVIEELFDLLLEDLQPVSQS